MTPRSLFACVLFISVTAAPACAPEELAPEDIARGGDGLIAGNGTSLNGVQMNGVQMNGVQMNGVQMNGVQMNGVQMNGVQVNGAELTAVRADNGQLVGGAGLEGATLAGALSNGSQLELKLDDIQPTADPEIYLYTVLYWTGSSWASLCGEQGGAPVQAIPLSGRWDYSSGTPTGGDHVDDPGLFTFACLGAALAKCALLGYEPWGQIDECYQGTCAALPLRPLHQACTRMIRADYCGDGSAHTTDGTPINLWDNFGVQVSAGVLNGWDSGWYREAEWGTEGALCVSKLRYDSDVTTDYIEDHCYTRWNAPFSCFGGDSTFFTENGLTTPLAARSLLRNEFEDTGN